MKYRVMKKWVKALRSGDYEQGSGRLVGYDINSFCCLGVLCNLAEKENVIDICGYDNRVDLPKEVMEWSGVKDNNGARKGKRKELSHLNDKGMSFKRIADIIEREYKDL